MQRLINYMEQLAAATDKAEDEADEVDLIKLCLKLTSEYKVLRDNLAFVDLQKRNDYLNNLVLAYDSCYKAGKLRTPDPGCPVGHYFVSDKAERQEKVYQQMLAQEEAAFRKKQEDSPKNSVSIWIDSGMYVSMIAPEGFVMGNFDGNP